MIALIDGDIVCYRAAAVTEGKDLGLAVWQAEVTLKRILQDIGATEHIIFLTGSDNFRYKVYPQYKANRRDIKRPEHWNPLKEHLVVNWNAEMTHGCEADDAIGIASNRNRSGTVVCSIDKDLRQLPGIHYNFVRQELDQVSEDEANYNLWFQALTGDRSDNIIGIQGVGKIGAGKILERAAGCRERYSDLVLDCYINNNALDRFIPNLQCLWIWRKRDDIWKATEKLELDLTL